VSVFSNHESILVRLWNLQHLEQRREVVNGLFGKLPHCADCAQPLKSTKIAAVASFIVVVFVKKKKRRVFCHKILFFAFKKNASEGGGCGVFFVRERSFANFVESSIWNFEGWEISNSFSDCLEKRS
jgi:hypothetical protein